MKTHDGGQRAEDGGSRVRESTTKARRPQVKTKGEATEKPKSRLLRVFVTSRFSFSSVFVRVARSLLAGCVFLVVPAFAQYYERSDEREEHRMIYAGFLVRDFQPRSSNPLTDSLSISMNKFIPTIGFRQGMVDFYVGYNTFALRGQRKATLSASVTVANEFPILFSRTHALLVPVMISSDYTKVENTGGDRENFNIGSVGLGAGVKYRYRSPQFEFSLLAAEAAHWSLEGFSTGSGFSPATMGEALFTFHDVLSLDGIALGYRFRYQTWNMSNAKFDYKSFSHGAFVGVMF